MKFLLAVAVALASHAQAVRVNVIQTYGAANCSGAVTSTYINGLSGDCTSYSESISASMTCTDSRTYRNSTTCEGDFTAEPLSCFGLASPTASAKYTCKEYAAVVRLTLFPSCNATLGKGSPGGTFPLDVCVPGLTDSGLGYSSDMESVLFVLSGNQVKVTTFSNKNCQGTGNASIALASEGCSTVTPPQFGPGYAAVKVQVYGTSSAAGFKRLTTAFCCCLAGVFVVVNTFNARDCAGAINASFIQGPAGACEYKAHPGHHACDQGQVLGVPRQDLRQLRPERDKQRHAALGGRRGLLLVGSRSP
ncbi:hypothetical protein BASA81_000525 [Batrachochytrium salamandrivorans]|nr:hypothetical protein BASA81_000525 [Batrachochytrium salamandrivorans]